MPRTGMIYSDVYLEHETGRHPESPVRLTSVLEYLDRVGALDVLDVFPPRMADVEQLRASADETIVELVSLQDKLNLNAGLTEEFLQAVLRSEIAKQRVETTQVYLAETRDQLDELVSRRTSSPNEINLELVECGVIAPMVNLPERLRFAALAAIATFLTVAVGQWWTARRATPRNS